MAECRDTSLDKKRGRALATLLDYSSRREIGRRESRIIRRFAPGPAEVGTVDVPVKQLKATKGGEDLDDMMWPVIKLSGELILLITLANECSGLVSSSGISEYLKLVIPSSVADILRIEVGDMICLRVADGKFHMQVVKSHVQ